MAEGEIASEVEPPVTIHSEPDVRSRRPRTEIIERISFTCRARIRKVTASLALAGEETPKFS